MDFNFIDYQIFNTKKFLKHTKLLFIFSSTRLKPNNWLPVEQALKLVKIGYRNMYNTVTSLILKNSILKNSCKLTINGSTLFSTLNRNFFKNNKNNLLFFSKKLESVHLFINFLFTKLNNKLYSNCQIKKVKHLIYGNSLIILFFLIKKTTKKNFVSCF